MKKVIFLSLVAAAFTLMTVECKAENHAGSSDKAAVNSSVIHLTDASFKKLVFNYESGNEWKYEGTLPAIIDFYADWCAPCRQLSPLVEELAREYSGKIVVYKVDTVKEDILARNLGITGLPTLLFIPAKGKPQVAMGALPKESLVQAINDVLMVK